jgi:hypothetical protein
MDSPNSATLPPAMLRGHSIALGKCLVLALGLSLLGFAFFASLAQANDRFTLDAHAETPGNVVEDGAGSAYIAWTHEPSVPTLPNVPMFCKVPAGGTCTAPMALTIPSAVDDTESVSGVFPVLGAGSTVYVVAPRYVKNDVVIWTSTNGGETFGAGTAYAGGYSGKTNPSSVLLRGSELLIGADNAGLGFSETPAAGGAGHGFSFASPGVGGVAGSSLALDSSGNPVEAYWNLSNPYEVLFYRYKGSGNVYEEANWVGPTAVAAGYESKLAGGAAGLFLVSQDIPGGGTEPTTLDVRKYTGTNFGPPVALADDASVDLFAGGAIAEAPSGLLAIAWPSAGTGTMRLFTSSDGGASFAESEIAHLGSAYSDMNNAQLAIGSNGQGWLTYIDAAGLQVADLTPIPLPAPVTPTPPASPAKATPKVFSGRTQTITKVVGGNLLTLTVPEACLAPDQPFYIGVGKKARHKVARSLRSKMKVVKVTFAFDGKKLKTLKKRPFRYLVHPGTLAAGGKHTVTARVTAIVKRHGHSKRVVRTLTGQISIC